MLYYLFIFASSVFCELFVAFDFGFHQKTELLSVIAVNGITFPVLTSVAYFLSSSNVYTWYVLIGLNILVFIIEWRLLQIVLKNRSRLFDVAFGMNLMSFIVGSLFVL